MWCVVCGVWCGMVSYDEVHNGAFLVHRLFKMYVTFNESNGKIWSWMKLRPSRVVPGKNYAQYFK